MKYNHQDQILPLLQMRGELPDPCPVTVEITDKFVYLFVGQRDWQWDKETGRLIGAGLCHTDGTRSGMRADLGVIGSIPVNLPFCLGNPSERVDGTEDAENSAMGNAVDEPFSPLTASEIKGFTILWKPEDSPQNQ